MRTFITLASTLVLLLATTTTISVTDATPCEDCIFAAIYATSPTCDAQIFTNPLQGGALTERQKSCFCPLASSDTWLQQCIKPELCTAKDVNDQLTGFKGFKAEACGSAVTTTAAVTTSTTSTDKTISSATATTTTSSESSSPTSAGSRLHSSPKVVVSAIVAVFAALL